MIGKERDGGREKGWGGLRRDSGWRGRRRDEGGEGMKVTVTL